MFMDQIKSTARRVRTSIEPSQPISIAIIYKDAASRDDAEKLCRRLARNLEADFQFCLKWWRFETLGDSRVAEAAATAAASADLVIVSTRAGRDLPRKVKEWMQSCLKNRKPQDAALVALVRMAKDFKRGAMPVLGFLSSIAQLARMDYLPEIIYPVAGRG
jgi:hypothetical protein